MEQIYETVIRVFGQGEQLSMLQMSARAVVVSGICLILLRFSGRRSFGMHMPLDNVIAILLGAILSRAVVGASPFFPVIAAATTISVLYRFSAWLCLYSKFFGSLLKGDAKQVYSNGKINQKNLNYCRISEKDLREGIRQNSNLDSFDKIKSIYVERNGKISVVKKEN